MSTDRHKAISDGVAEAFDFWLSQYPISTPECIEVAVMRVFDCWLDNHKDEIVAAVADRASS